ncbi:hypothetical protein M408DRAFT_327308 [Serendipita vermifera MAFF 305830]|uniref:Uncharacterized protein n=1 Tax=Serendipita vermifera MAFF 305830 TaxID=933852 RepID=A0A0C3BIF5_SERVB|nr:hypothetical protein M408DRAFT_327308 [Serendipita vermifera MAFF 305830]
MPGHIPVAFDPRIQRNDRLSTNDKLSFLCKSFIKPVFWLRHARLAGKGHQSASLITIGLAANTYCQWLHEHQWGFFHT